MLPFYEILMKVLRRAATNSLTPSNFRAYGLTIKDVNVSWRPGRSLTLCPELGISASPTAIATRALENIRAMAAAASGDLSPIFGKASNVLERSLAQLQKRATREEDSRERGGAGSGAEYLEDLDQEDGPYPFSKTTKGMDRQVEQLVTRIYRDALQKYGADKGPAPSVPSLPQRHMFASDDSYNAAVDSYNTAMKTYNNYMRKVIRKAMTSSHPDQYGSLPPEQKKLFLQAMSIFSEAQDRYK